MNSSLPATSYQLQAKSGFTLIEVLIVVGIGVLVLAVGSLYLVGYRNNRHVETQAQELVTLLQSAQEKSSGQENGSRWGVHVVNPSEGRGTYAIFEVDEDLLSAEPPYDAAPGTVLEQLTLPENTTFALPVSGEQTTVVFAKGTGLPVATATITIQSAGNELSVYVESSGRIEFR